MTDRRDPIESWSAMPPEKMAAFDPDGDFSRRHLIDPAVFALLGPLAGRRVLDAGCGQGYLSRLLADRGATVVGLEPAEGLVRYAEAREAERRQGVTYLRADLTAQNLDPEFDAVVANMVLMAIPDWRAALATCVGALRPGGRLVLSLTHPCFERLTERWAAAGHYTVDEYFAEYVLDEPVAPDFHRPLSAYLTAVADLGCRITDVVEPRLDAGVATDAGPGAEALVHLPAFVVVAADRE